MAFGGLVPDSVNGALGFWLFWGGVAAGAAVSRPFWDEIESKFSSSRGLLDMVSGKAN